MDKLMTELMEDFILLKSYSEYCCYYGEREHEAQDMTAYVMYKDYVKLYEKAIAICVSYFIDKNIQTGILELSSLGLHEEVKIIQLLVRCVNK